MSSALKPESIPVKFACELCGQPVQLIDGKLVRFCDHVEGAITASMSATASGRSKLNNETNERIQT